MKQQILGIIPSRYGSTRLPGKPLLEITGKPMICHVYEKAKRAKSLTDLVVATDDQRIFTAIESMGGKAMMTSSAHPCGTDRCSEVLLKMGGDFDYVVNVQGDEPMLNPAQIDQLADVLDGQVEIATQMTKITEYSELWSAGEVKIVKNSRNEALYFSREAIPHLRNQPKDHWHEKHVYYKHIGMYAYRADILLQLSKLTPSELENAEFLEQLRWLEAGYKIKLVNTDFTGISVDTPDDLKKVKSLMEK